MADIWPNEGVDGLLEIFPRGATYSGTTELRCFSNFTASTVMGTAQGTVDVTECAWTNYSAQDMVAATWGAIASTTNGRSVTYPQQNMGTCGATPGTANGFYITWDGGGSVVAMANFDDTTAVVLAENDVLKITPTLEMTTLEA